jgi:tRNA-intron endonuclease, archaea type
MSDDKANPPITSEFKARGVMEGKCVRVADQSSVDALSQRGYGTKEGDTFTITFYEALYLVEKKMLEVKGAKGTSVDFQTLLQAYEQVDENAWAHYLIYRDLRSRGYVVREGFGAAIDFRIYERGTYGKDTATSLVLSTQEGQPMPMEDLTNALSQCQSLKKDMVLAVMNRRGEIVYYSVSPLSFK